MGRSAREDRTVTDRRTSKIGYVLALIALQVVGVIFLLLLDRSLLSVVSVLLVLNGWLLITWILSKRRKKTADE